MRFMFMRSVKPPHRFRYEYSFFWGKSRGKRERKELLLQKKVVIKRISGNARG